MIGTLIMREGEKEGEGEREREDMILLPSNVDFWQYTSSYREQPDVNFLNRLLIQVSGEGGSSLWSSFPNLNSLLQTEELATPVVQVCKNCRTLCNHWS
jgi:hypothetical protein